MSAWSSSILTVRVSFFDHLRADRDKILSIRPWDRTKDDKIELERFKEMLDGGYENYYAKIYRKNQLKDEEKAYPVYRHLLDTRKATKQKLWQALWEDKKHRLGLSPETPFAESCGRAWSTKPSQRHNGTVLSRMLDASRAEKMCESLTMCSGYSCKDGGCELFAGSNLSSEEGYDTYVKDMPHSSAKEAYLATLCPWFMDWHLVEEGGVYYPTHRLTFAGSCNVTREYEIGQCAEQQGRVQASCHTFGVWLEAAQIRLSRMQKEMAIASLDAKTKQANQQERYKRWRAVNTAQRKVELAQKAAEARNPPFSPWGIVSTIASLAGPLASLVGLAAGAEDPVQDGMEAAFGLIGAIGDTGEKYSAGGGNGKFEDEQHEQEWFEAVSEQITKSEEASMQKNTEILHAELDFAKETLGAVGSEISAAQTGTDALCGVPKQKSCRIWHSTESQSVSLSLSLPIPPSRLTTAAGMNLETHWLRFVKQRRKMPASWGQMWIAETTHQNHNTLTKSHATVCRLLKLS